MKNCPRCRLINPSEAQRCDCGFAFDSGIMQASLLEAREQRLAPALRLGAGVFGGVSALLGWFGLVLGAIAASIAYGMYRRQAPRAAGDGLQAYGIGVGIVVLAASVLWLFALAGSTALKV